MQLTTGPNDNNRRLDRILRKALPEMPLSLIHKLLRQGKIRVNGKRAEPQDRIPEGAVIQWGVGSGEWGVGNKTPSSPHSLLPTPHSPPSPYSLLLYQDSNLLILNKPAGMAVHGPDSLDTQVQNYLAGYLSRPENASLSFKSGPLHRLDKPTSGAIVFSKSLEGARNFSAWMREGKIQKFYLAIAEGCIREKETWDNQLVRDKVRGITSVAGNTAAENAAQALTIVTPLSVSGVPYKDKYTFILAQIHTGKTHQIRAQAAAHGHPLAGDRKYGGNALPRSPLKSFFLHAWKMNINDMIKISAPMPEAFAAMIQALFSRDAEKMVNSIAPMSVAPLSYFKKN